MISAKKSLQATPTNIINIVSKNKNSKDLVTKKQDINKKTSEFQSLDDFFHKEIQKKLCLTQNSPLEKVLEEVNFLKKLENYDKSDTNLNKKLLKWKRTGMGKIKSMYALDTIEKDLQISNAKHYIMQEVSDFSIKKHAENVLLQEKKKKIAENIKKKPSFSIKNSSLISPKLTDKGNSFYICEKFSIILYIK